MHHEKLWMFGRDERQSYGIWERLLGIMDKRTALKVLDIALYLERVERFGGAAR